MTVTIWNGEKLSTRQSLPSISTSFPDKTSNPLHLQKQEAIQMASPPAHCTYRTRNNSNGKSSNPLHLQKQEAIQMASPPAHCTYINKKQFKWQVLQPIAPTETRSNSNGKSPSPLHLQKKYAIQMASHPAHCTYRIKKLLHLRCFLFPVALHIQLIRDMHNI